MTTAIVIDWGLFPELALRLARDLDHVYYHSPCFSSFPDPKDSMIGKGFEDLRVERIDWPLTLVDHEDSPDAWVFPDLYFADFQQMLRDRDKAVWGAGWAETLEADRWHMREILGALDMPVIPADTVEGIDTLEKFLEKSGERYVKVAQYYRGATETFHHLGGDLHSRRWLNDLRSKTGPAGRDMKFLLEKPIAGDAVEPGLDFMFVNGQPLFPALLGYEIKGSGMVSRVIHEVPEPLKPIEALFPALDYDAATTFFSCETRVIDGECYVLDPCCRMPSPGDAMHLEMWRNITPIIMRGAGGEAVTPDPVAEYAVQFRLRSSAVGTGAVHVSMPEGIRDMVKLRRLYRDEDGELWIMPDLQHPDMTVIGGAVGFGDTPKEAYSQALAHAKAIKAEGLEFDEDLLENAEKEIEKGKKNGIEF